MGSLNHLKDRFEKLQKATAASQEVVSCDVVTNPPENKIELTSSKNPEIHKVLRNCSSKTYDWKKKFKETFKRPAIESKRHFQLNEIETKLQHLSKNSIIIAFSLSDSLNTQAPYLLSHIQKKSAFWSKLLMNSEHLHLYSEKNKIYLGIRYTTYTAAKKERIQGLLESECYSENQSIKTFNAKSQDDWVEVSFEIVTTNDDKGLGEANL